ncbi:hypothetical protein AYO47_01830 [Planctomyces sp. SCGC AG-212-M04]|nr:hypothetical protein AYO47_01830 [Planctomyces sp. SCGC AG-212-M04]
MGDSVTEWVERFRGGDRSAGDLLWARYRETLAEAARNRYRAVLTAAGDEDDLIQSVFLALWKSASKGTLPEIPSREMFWWFLLAVTRSKVLDRAKSAGRIKRLGSTVQFSQAPGEENWELSLPDLHIPQQEFLAILLEEQEQLLAILHDDSLRQIALCKIDGLSQVEIASRLGVNVRTVERKTTLIRERWLQYYMRHGGLDHAGK